MNKKDFSDLDHCPVTATLEIIGGKWKILVLYLIANESNRFGKLSMMLKHISKQMLTTQLRELEVDGLIDRKIFPEIPPRVEYTLTEKGKALMPIMAVLKEWGLEYLMNEKVKV